jgi:hypothetical protein
METFTSTCTRCRNILEFYRPDFNAIGVPFHAKQIDEVIRRHTLTPYRSWPLSSPRSKSEFMKNAYQCNAEADHRWVINEIPSLANVRPIGG